MQRSTLPLLAALSILAAPALGAPLQLERILDAKSDYVLLIRDVGALTEALQASPWAALWQDATEAVETMPDSSRARWETGHEVVGILSHLTGPAAVVADLGDLTADDLENPSEQDRRWALLVGSENEATVTSLVENQEALHLATVKNVTILSGSPGYLEELSDAVQHGPRSPLVDQPDFQTLQKTRHGRTDAVVYVDLASTVALLRQAILKSQDAGAGAGAGQNLEAMGITPQGALDALHLDALRAFGLGIGLEPDGAHVTSGLLASGDQGLMSLLAYLPGPCPRLPFIPQQVLSASVYRYDIPAAWDGAMALLDAMSPALAGLFQTQMDQLTMAANVDLRRDVIGQFGQTFFSVRTPPAAGEDLSEGAGNQVFGVEVRDRAALESSIHALLDGMGAAESFTSREVAGSSVLSMPMPGRGPGAEISFAFTDTYFLVGIGSGDLDAILGSMKKPGPSIWNRRDLKPLLAGVPKEASGIGVVDVGAMVEQMVSRIPAEKRGTLSEANLDRIAQRLGVAVSYATKTPDGFFSTTQLVYRKP